MLRPFSEADGTIEEGGRLPGGTYRSSAYRRTALPYWGR